MGSLTYHIHDIKLDQMLPCANRIKRMPPKRPPPRALPSAMSLGLKGEYARQPCDKGQWGICGRDWVAVCGAGRTNRLEENKEVKRLE